jgi:hypothetical protein
MPAMICRVHIAASVVLSIASVLLPVQGALAFGPAGHRIVGHIADQYLCPDARRELGPLLGTLTLADAGVWPDQLRSRPEWAHSKPWHYINVTDNGSVAAAARASDDNVLAVLARFEAALRNRKLPLEQRSIALRFIAHLVADIHQPLHVGRQADRGGNRVEVIVRGKRSNLHAVWDGLALSAAARRRPADYARQLEMATPEIQRWQAAGPLVWAHESMALRPVVYAFGTETVPPTLSQHYLDTARTVLDQRLAQAGIRLAGRLNAAFDCRTR